MRGWVERTPDDFIFALKLPQEITHERRLRDAKDRAGQFYRALRASSAQSSARSSFSSGPTSARPSCPRWRPSSRQLPRDIRVAIEFRDRGWIHDGMLALLAEHEVALTLDRRALDPAPARCSRWPSARRRTSSYVRWMGPNRDIVDYSRIQVDRSRELEAWAAMLAPLGAARDRRSTAT